MKGRKLEHEIDFSLEMEPPLIKTFKNIGHGSADQYIIPLFTYRKFAGISWRMRLVQIVG
jgi:hypothetical protein